MGMSDEDIPVTPKPTVEIPDDWQPEPQAAERYPFAFVDQNGDDDDERDTSLPVGYDEHGNAIFAPRGIRYQW
jgi:hypothetical protein